MDPCHPVGRAKRGQVNVEAHDLGRQTVGRVDVSRCDGQHRVRRDRETPHALARPAHHHLCRDRDRKRLSLRLHLVLGHEVGMAHLVVFVHQALEAANLPLAGVKISPVENVRARVHRRAVSLIKTQRPALAVVRRVLGVVCVEEVEVLSP